MKKAIYSVLLLGLIGTLVSCGEVSSSLSNVSSEEINQYYKNVDLLSSGDELRTSLYNTISVHTAFDYSSLADIMTITDRDWTLSPSESDKNPYMRLIYANYNFSTETAAKRSDYNTIWDKEHIWCKSKGGAFGTTKGVGSDLHHLRASDKPNNNNHRNSRNFGNVTDGSVGEDYKGNASGKYSGSGTDGIFEPLDQDKGDVARACFYMYVTYPTYCKGIVSSPAGNGNYLGILADMLAWNESDPVDEFEMNRNNLIFKKYQKNRNPFIDYPSLARKLFSK